MGLMLKEFLLKREAHALIARRDAVWKWQTPKKVWSVWWVWRMRSRWMDLKDFENN